MNTPPGSHLFAEIAVSAFLVGIPAGWWCTLRFGRPWLVRYYRWRERKKRHRPT